MSEENVETAGSSRKPRSASSRNTTSQRKPWTPPQVLETPPAPDGMRYRWIRTAIRGEEDKSNVHMRMREGFEPVHPSEVEGYSLPVIDEGKNAGTVGVGGLMLSKIPDETAEERNAYYSRKTDNQMAAVDNDLMKDEHPSMPISRERKTRVSFGASNK